MSWFKGVERALRRRFPKLDVHVRPSATDLAVCVAVGHRFEHDEIDLDWARIGVYSALAKNTFVAEASKRLLEQCYPYQKFPVH